ncbi:TIGR02302 family protein [Methylocella silvestris]|uniref:TIGR02302 family protein n=1 Tax=Methylocella silvestris TaxID=199596 RepID=A0A2J7TMR0_METSI|nr:TIGR02302 family protein [Methylocella silvestris]PNG28058.1 TIGR02302 family protein [Methylocella silvestris]
MANFGRPSGKDVASEGRLGSAARPAQRLDRLVLQGRALLLFERSWRALTPALIVAGAFLALSFTGLWLETPHWARLAGVALFAAALAFALWPMRRLRLPTRREALERIDRVSGLKERPAAVLDDRLGNADGDPETEALWALHRRRAERQIALLRTGSPSPRVVDVDRYALRAAVLVALVAAAFIAGPEKYARVAAAFDWRFASLASAGQRIDAWVDPPPYTGRSPIVLTQRVAGPSPEKIEAPVGSVIVIRGSAGKPAYRATGALVEPPRDDAREAPAKDAGAPGPNPPAPAATQVASSAAHNEARLVLRGDAGLAIEGVGSFDFASIPDKPPTIALAAVPRPNARGSLTLRYQIKDDYGAISAEAVFANPVLPDGKPSSRSLVEAPKAALQLPPAGDEAGEAETTIDLSENPWAGARAQMTLVAHDEGGNEGKSEAFTIVLPQKPFVKPLARALVEQRRNLVLNPDDKGSVSTALDALMIAPDSFDVSDGVYLGLRVASERLAAASSDKDLIDVADYLWQMALRLEEGDLSEAERDLRAAQQQLREALQRNAPPEEIKRLTDNLRAAMDKFLREFAEQQQQKQEDADQGADDQRGSGKSISEKELKAMLDKMQQLAQNGDPAEAQKMLEQMQNILENLKMAQHRKRDPQSREMSRALNELDRMSREQQQLRDETYQKGEAAKRQQRRQRGALDELQDEEDLSGGEPDQPGEDGDPQQEADQKPGGKSEPGKSQAELEKRQEDLRQRLEDLEQRLKKAGQGGPGLSEAQKAMQEAKKALGQGARGSDSAVEAQGRALDGLREGAQKLAQAMGQQGEGEGQGQAQGEGQGEGQEGPGQQGQYGQDGTDPLGRPSGRERAFNPSAKYDPMGVPAAERAQRVLEELRRRLGDFSRPREEMDYLERLLRRY